MHLSLAAALLAAVLLQAAPARAELDGSMRSGRFQWFGASERDQEMYFCVLLPYRNCDRAIDIALVYGGGNTWGGPEQTDLVYDLGDDSMQLMADVGYLHRVTNEHAILIGPMIGIEAEHFREAWRFRIQASARSRIWLGEWATFEAALGVVGAFDDNFRPRGLGGLLEVAFTLHGHVGVYVQTQVIDGHEGIETRVTAGLRGSLVTWAVLVLGVMG